MSHRDPRKAPQAGVPPNPKPLADVQSSCVHESPSDSWNHSSTQTSHERSRGASHETNRPFSPLSTAPAEAGTSALITATVAARLGLRRAVLVALGLSVAVNILLGVHVAACRPLVTTVLIPPSGGAWSVSNETADAAYLERMALDLSQTLSTLTPSNAKKRLLNLLSFVAPEYHAELEADLLREAKKLIADNASIVFYPEHVNVSEADLAASVSGVRKTMLGSDVTSSVAVTYHFLFRMEAGRLFLVRLGLEEGDRDARNLEGKRSNWLSRTAQSE